MNTELLRNLGKDKRSLRSMDPLGAPSQFVDVDTLPSWGNSCEDQLNASAIAAETYQEETIRLSIIRISMEK